MTILEKWKELYPDKKLSSTGLPWFCPNYYLEFQEYHRCKTRFGSAAFFSNGNACQYCWNQEYKEQEASTENDI